jgi:putative two-component system response regulator
MRSETFHQATILIVDDQQPNIRLLERILQPAGYTHVHGTRDPREIGALCRKLSPDLILLDLHMPYVSGLRVLEQLEEHIRKETFLPILVITADTLPETRQKALAAGATDFLTKPFDPTEVLLRVRNLLETRFLYHELEKRVQERTRQLEEAQLEMLRRLALASDSRDDETGRHTHRVGCLSAALARLAGLPEEQVDLIGRAAPLHDIGKIGISDQILLKPGPLTAEEFEQMKTHTVIGGRILGGSKVPVLQLAEQIALYHHERWDGSGYQGLAGEQIPKEARIVALADVFDVLTHLRPYKAAWPVEKALAEIESQSGRHFDPDLAELFLRERMALEIRQLAEAVEGTPLTIAAPAEDLAPTPL